MTTPCHRGLRVAFLALTIVVTGCGIVDHGPVDTPGQPVPVSAGASSRAATPKPHRNIIAWLVGLGPGTPSGPNVADTLNIYQDLQAGRCESRLGNRFLGGHDDLGKGLDLYIGAIAACMAALHGGTNTGPTKDPTNDWELAEQVLATDVEVHDCLDSAVRALLENLVTAHRDNPYGRFVAGTGGGVAAPLCPHTTGVAPRHARPGQTVVITGRHLDRVESVNIITDPTSDWDNGTPVTDTVISARSITVVVPTAQTEPAGTPPLGEVLLALSDRTTGWIASVAFTIDP